MLRLRHLDQRRAAVCGVRDELARDSEPSAGMRLAMRTYGAGCLAVAVGGPVDAAEVARLRTVVEAPLVRDLSRCELVIDLSGLTVCDRSLIHLLRRLATRPTDGGGVEVRCASEASSAAMSAHLGDASLTEAFTIYDAVRDRPR